MLYLWRRIVLYVTSEVTSEVNKTFLKECRTIRTLDDSDLGQFGPFLWSIRTVDDSDIGQFGHFSFGQFGPFGLGQF